MGIDPLDEASQSLSRPHRRREAERRPRSLDIRYEVTQVALALGLEHHLRAAASDRLNEGDRLEQRDRVRRTAPDVVDAGDRMMTVLPEGVRRVAGIQDVTGLQPVAEDADGAPGQVPDDEVRRPAVILRTELPGTVDPCISKRRRPDSGMAGGWRV